jgi:hypothetical protein
MASTMEAAFRRNESNLSLDILAPPKAKARGAIELTGASLFETLCYDCFHALLKSRLSAANTTHNCEFKASSGPHQGLLSNRATLHAK